MKWHHLVTYQLENQVRKVVTSFTSSHHTIHSSLETTAKGNVKINMNAGTLTMEQGIESQVFLLKDYFSTKLGTCSLQYIKMFLKAHTI